jgi:hypothetical protein
MTTYWIAWNEAKTEGFITDDKVDAQSARTGKCRRARGYSSISSVADAFHDCYEDDKFPRIQKIEIR